MVADPIEQRLPTFAELPLCGYPDRPVLFAHELHLDERMTPAAVADLADRLPVDEVVYEHRDQAAARALGGPTAGRPGAAG